MLSPLAATMTCTFLVGMIVSLWERLPWVMSERLKMPESACRAWQSWYSFPLIILFPLLGHFIDHWDGHYVLFIGILGLAFGLAGLGQVRSMPAALAALLVLCLAIPCVALPTLAILPRAFSILPNIVEGPAAEQFNHFKAVLVLNASFLGVLLGMIFTPTLVNFAVKHFSVRHGFLYLALLCIIPALFVSLAPGFYQTKPRSVEYVLRDELCWMLAGLTFNFYLLAELFGSWKTGYLQQSERDKPWVRFVFWLMMLASLPIAGWAVWDKYEAWGLAVLALFHAVVVGNMAGEFTDKSGTFSLWMAGASFAPLLPTLLTIPMRAFADCPATVMGLALGTAALGNFLFQPMLERFAQRSSVAWTMWLSMILSLCFGALALVLALMSSLAIDSPR